MSKFTSAYEITFAMLAKERILEYLDWLEANKKCSVQTRNLRLAAIRAFFACLFRVMIQSPQHFNQWPERPSRKQNLSKRSLLSRL